MRDGNNRIPPAALAALAAAASQTEPGIRYNGELVRDLSDEDLKKYLDAAAAAQQGIQMAMQNAVLQYGQHLAIANVLAFEHERRTKKLRVIGGLDGLRQ